MHRHRLGHAATSVEPPGLLHLLDPEDQQTQSEPITRDLKVEGQKVEMEMEVSDVRSTFSMACRLHDRLSTHLQQLCLFVVVDGHQHRHPPGELPRVVRHRR